MCGEVYLFGHQKHRTAASGTASMTDQKLSSDLKCILYSLMTTRASTAYLCSLGAPNPVPRNKIEMPEL